MANLKSKQLASLLTFTTASIDVVSGSLIPDAASLYSVGSSTVPYLSGSFTNLELRLDTNSLGYTISSQDEVIGFGKFNS